MQVGSWSSYTSIGRGLVAAALKQLQSALTPGEDKTPARYRHTPLEPFHTEIHLNETGPILQLPWKLTGLHPECRDDVTRYHL